MLQKNGYRLSVSVYIVRTIAQKVIPMTLFGTVVVVIVVVWTRFSFKVIFIVIALGVDDP